MGTKTVDASVRDLARASMKAGMEMGFDKCVLLVQRITEAWGESQSLPDELRSFRTKVLADMQTTLDNATGGAK